MQSCPKAGEFEEIYKIMWKTASVKNFSNTHLKEIVFGDIALIQICIINAY